MTRAFVRYLGVTWALSVSIHRVSAISFKTAKSLFCDSADRWRGRIDLAQSNIIRRCSNEDFEHVCAIINNGATAYRGVIPEDCWAEPYISMDDLRQELAAGVMFWGYETNGNLQGVMGLQSVQDVTLIRHAYVATAWQRQGIGASLLSYLRQFAKTPHKGHNRFRRPSGGAARVRTRR